jgi:molecular chaperone DnaJ
LVCQLPISFAEAALGAAVEVPTLKASDQLVIPAGTQHGEVFKLKGKGLPDVRSHRTGDQLVQVIVEIPKKLSDRQKQLLREYLASEAPQVDEKRKTFMSKLKEMFKSDEK